MGVVFPVKVLEEFTGVDLSDCVGQEFDMIGNTLMLKKYLVKEKSLNNNKEGGKPKASRLIEGIVKLHVDTENLSTQQVSNITGNNGNVYVERLNFFKMYQNGVNFSGAYFDEIIYLDKLVNEIELNVADLLYQTPKVPQTEAGMASIRSVIAQACENSKEIGFIAPGVWNGTPILSLNTGDYLPNGYLIQSQSIASQSQADRDARIAPPVYVAIKLAGAVQSIIIQIDVNR
jgi:hypothetical protein